MDTPTSPSQYPNPSADMGYSCQFDPLVQYETYVYNTDYYQPHSFQSSDIPNPAPYFDFAAHTPAPQATFENEPQLPTPSTLGQPSSFMSPLIISSPQEELTPPLITSAGEEGQQTVEVSVSTAFHPGSHSDPSDLVFCTADSVLFYVNARTIQKSSRQAFSRILHAPITSPKHYEQVVNVPDTSDVLNVILHCLYGTSYAQNLPSFDTPETAIDRMPLYSITPSKHIISGTPSYTYILSHVALHPVRLYALTAHHNLEELAAISSSHLLGVPLSSIHDDMAEKMGPVYLNRLVHLLVPRVETLKNMLFTPPMPHPATKLCTFEDQNSLTKAWALVAAYLAWDARPDLSTYSIRAGLNPLLDDLSCEVCMKGLKDRIKNVIVEWANVKRTI